MGKHSRLLSMLRNHRNGVTTLLMATGETYKISLEGPNGEHPTNDIECDSDVASGRAEELVQKYYPHNCEELRCEDWKGFGNPV